ncbi:MAG TPA: GAF domain-containing protein, partial [Polyangiales bacterium]|nr:GAF domain-containing protein [Polyangiales bacterium]
EPGSTEAERLRAELAERDAAMAVVLGIQQSIGAGLDFRAIVETVGEKLREVFATDDLSILWWDEPARTFHGVYAIEHGQRIDNPSFPVRPDGFMDRFAREPRTVVFHSTGDQLAAGFGVIEGTDRARSIVGVPMRAGERFLGVTFIENHQRDRAFDPASVALLETISSGMALALQNAQSFENERRRNAELAVINSIQQGMSGSLDFAQISELVGETLRTVMKVEDVMLSWYDHETGLIHGVYVLERGKRFKLEPFAPTPRGLWNRVAPTRRTLRIDDCASDPSPLLPGTDPPRSLLAAPIVGSDRVIGLISLQSLERTHAFTEADERMLATVGASMGLALENARLFDETQRLLKETAQRAAELAVVNSVQEGLASKLDMRAIYDLVGDKVRDIFDAQVVLLGTFDHGRDVEVFDYVFENGERLHPRERAINRTRRELIETRRPIVINDLTPETMAARGGAAVDGTVPPKSVIFAPMLTGQTVGGYISIQNLDRNDAFTNADLRLLQTLASSASIALENARLFDETQHLLEQTEQRAAELAVINSIQHGVSGSLDFQGIIDLVGEKLREVFGTGDIGIRWLDHERREVDYLCEYEHGR